MGDTARHLYLRLWFRRWQSYPLEIRLGVELFDRTSRPVRPTPAGDRLLLHAGRILTDVLRASAEIRAMARDTRDRIRVGAMQYLTVLEVPDLLVEFERLCPDAELHLRVGNGELPEMLLDGEIDVALCHADRLDLPRAYAVVGLRLEELVVLVAESDRLADRHQITVEDLAAEQIIVFGEGASIRVALRDAFERTNVVPNVAFECADLLAAVSLVARGLGVTLVPRSVARQPGTRAVALGPVQITRQVAVAWTAEQPLNGVVGQFLALVRAAFGAPHGPARACRTPQPRNGRSVGGTLTRDARRP